MKIRFRFIIMVFLVSLLLNLASAGIAQEEPYLNIKIPIFPDATDVRHSSNIKQCAKTTRYRVQMAYPATKVINYYEKEVAKLGFTELKNNVRYLNEWMEYGDGTRPGRPLVRRFGKEWREPKKNIRLLLFLEYEKNLPDRWNNNLLVICEITPFVPEPENKEAKDFFEKLIKEGKFEQFKKLLEKYSKANGTVDCEKAIRENPGNPYIVKYCSIEKEILKYLKCK